MSLYFIPDTKSKSSSASSTTSSHISSQHIEQVIESLCNKQTRESTTRNYLAIWRQFIKFLIQLGRKPDTWEHRVALYCGHLVEKGNQSSSIQCYISAIKAILKTDGYTWCDGKVALNIITHGCRLQNDRVKTRLPIHMKLLEMILFEIR